ncbi:MAG TPA: chemotaxis protein CheB [Planctomycetota bacterium]|nr:chemotaxis protein CheB [Planctomycetota bacterium]
MRNHDIVVIGASAGGVRALQALIQTLPADLAAAVFIVMHTSPTTPSALAGILGRSGRIVVSPAVDGERFRPGHVYTAQPGRHLLIENDRIVLSDGPRENRSRPSIDALFRSAATAYRGRVIGVVLTGYLDDGTAGLWAVKRGGGVTVVQDPDDAEHPCMPLNALRNFTVDHVVPIAGMAELLVRLVAAPVTADDTAPLAWDEQRQPDHVFVCPDCDGPLQRVQLGGDEPVHRFRCNVGHAHSLASLLSEHTEACEGALWAAVRSLEDEAVLTERAIEQGLALSNGEAVEVLCSRAQECRSQATAIRDMLARGQARRADAIAHAYAVTANAPVAPARETVTAPGR